MARIVVTDTGIRIPQGALPHLSEEFFYVGLADGGNVAG
jgi:hypothetical protein